LQIRGDIEKSDFLKRGPIFNEDPNVNNSTEFFSNRAGAGGAIFVEGGRSDVLMSPHIGGSDLARIPYNYYGMQIYFNKNTAYSAGGAIYTGRNMEVTGAGGAEDDYLYSLARVVRFDSNTAGYGGGAIYVEIPSDINSTH
jgi:predicted outer membrane repeat protein